MLLFLTVNGLKFFVSSKNTKQKYKNVHVTDVFKILSSQTLNLSKYLFIFKNTKEKNKTIF